MSAVLHPVAGGKHVAGFVAFVCAVLAVVLGAFAPPSMAQTPAPPTIAQAFAPAWIGSGGTATLSFSLASPSAVALANATFTDTLTNMTVASPVIGGTCAGVTNSPALAYGATALNLQVPSLPATGCTITVQVTSSTLGSNANTTSGVSTSQTGAGAPSNTAYLTVNPASVGFYYVHADHLGTPRAITRPSDNLLMWKWDNTEPFGNNPPNPDPMGSGVYFTQYNLRFPGQYYDQETGTHYNLMRDYDPNTGRFIEGDPIGLRGGLNLYGYVRADPLRFIDSLGLFSDQDKWRAWDQYCSGTGEDWTASFGSINWGDARSQIGTKIKSLVGNRCKNMTIPVDFDMSAQAQGADEYIINRHIVRTKGTLRVNCDCSWSFTGDISSKLGYDPYDFDASNRGFKGELLTWIGRNRCPKSGKPFNIYITGSEPLSMKGQVEGASACECGR